MNDHAPIETDTATPVQKTGLELLREPFPKNMIGKLPKPTKAQTDKVRTDYKQGIRCELCGAWHHKDVVHLDYVGHAALTDRLLDCDPEWNWEPIKVADNGEPVLDQFGGMWINLTVCGVTRRGYGDAAGKTGANAVKERIGDALRNAAMRFGAALDLWHKGDLHISDDVEAMQPEVTEKPAPPKKISAEQFQSIGAKISDAGVDADKIAAAYKVDHLHELTVPDFESAMRRLDKTISEKKPSDSVSEDEIPY